MRRVFVLGTLLSLLVVVTIAQQQSTPSVPEIPFVSVPNFFKMPTGMYFGDISDVAVNSQGHIFVASRSDISGPAFAPMGAEVLEFDKDGKFVREIGKGLYSFSFLHAIRVDKMDRIWVTDKISEMVTQFNPDGTLGMLFGVRPQSGYPEGQGPINELVGYTPPTDSVFRGPSSTVVDSKGNLLVAEGYGNNRIAVFDKNGVWVRSFGSRGSGRDQFQNLHDIAIDAKDHVYLADRQNNRILVYDSNNWTFVREFSPMKSIPYPTDIRAWTGNTPPPGVSGGAPGGTGAPWAVCVTPGPVQYLYVSDGFPGRIYKLTLEGKVLGMLGRSGRRLGEFGWPHGVSCPSENELYVADELNFRVQKLILNPKPGQTGAH